MFPERKPYSEFGCKITQKKADNQKIDCFFYAFSSKLSSLYLLYYNKVSICSMATAG